MTPPISIDGTDITGATIDGTDVTEITVDGQTVFRAETLPVAYSNLIAWYPFDSSFYGGSDTDDVTALFNPGQSGDSTAFDGTLVNSPTYDASGGVTDINAGANSGAYDFEASNSESIRTSLNSLSVSELTLMGWVEPESLNSISSIDSFFGQTSVSSSIPQYTFLFFGGNLNWQVNDGSSAADVTTSLSTGTWTHLTGVVKSDGTTELFKDGVSQGTGSGLSVPITFSKEFRIAEDNNPGSSGGTFHADGYIDDVRLYDTELTSSQINQIITNTPHP